MSGIAHFVHFVLTLLTGFIWLPIWILCALISGSSNRKRAESKKDEELRLLRQLVERSER